MTNSPLQFATEGFEIPDLPFGEHEALTLGAPANQLEVLRKVAIYGYLMAQSDINETTTQEDANG